MSKDLRTNGRIVLAWGEVTGHAHDVVCADTELPPGAEDALFLELENGVRELIVLGDNVILRHDEHGRIALSPSEAARGANGERDAQGRLIGQYRQGDVLLQPIGHGTWHHIQQGEGYSPEAWRAVAD